VVTTFYYGLAIVLYELRAYLRDMNKRNEAQNAITKTNAPLSKLVAGGTPKLGTLLRSALGPIFALLATAAMAMATELPEAPSSVSRTDGEMIEAVAPVHAPAIAPATSEVKPIDKKFVALAIMSTGSTFADSYTTLFARENWLAGKKGVCNVEVQSAYLYGTHPTVGRAYAVASLKSVGSVFAAYYMRKHHNRFWSLPLVANSVISLQGVGQNMAACN